MRLLLAAMLLCSCSDRPSYTDPDGGIPSCESVGCGSDELLCTRAGLCSCPLEDAGRVQCDRSAPWDESKRIMNLIQLLKVLSVYCPKCQSRITVDERSALVSCHCPKVAIIANPLVTRKAKTCPECEASLALTLNTNEVKCSKCDYWFRHD